MMKNLLDYISNYLKQQKAAREAAWAENYKYTHYNEHSGNVDQDRDQGDQGENSAH